MDQNIYNVLRALVATLIALHGQNQKIIDNLNNLLNTSSVVISVAASDDLQDKMNKAPTGSILELPAGITFTGHYMCNGGITITTAGFKKEGRVGIEDAPNMATLASPDALPAFMTALSAKSCWLSGLVVKTNGPRATAVMLGSNTATKVTDLPSFSGLKQVIIQGDETNLKRGVALHGSNLTVQDSYIVGARSLGQDTQAVWINNGPGPYTILNNQLEAAGEAVLIGGDRVSIPNLVPADISIKNNIFSRPMAWKDVKGYNVKNLLELKNAQRVVIDHNIFENHWQDAQPGYAIVMTPRNQYGDNPWVTVSDVTFSHNLIRNVGGGINILGDDDIASSAKSVRLSFTDNRLIITSKMYGGSGRCLQIGRAPQNITYSRNTCLSDGSSAIYTYAGGVTDPSKGLEVVDNFWMHNKYGFLIDGGTLFDTQYPGANWSGNVVMGGSSKNYPPLTIIVDQSYLTTIDPATGSQIGPTSTTGSTDAFITN